MIVSQDHSIWGLYGPKTGPLTEEKVGTRYVCLVIRTFMDPNDEKDVKAAHRLQDAVRVEQADIGKFEVPDWKKGEVEKMRETINVIAATVMDAGKMFGKKEELDPLYWMLGAALGWGGLPAEAASYVNVFPEKNDGKTPYTLTAKDVPVDAFYTGSVMGNFRRIRLAMRKASFSMPLWYLTAVIVLVLVIPMVTPAAEMEDSVLGVAEKWTGDFDDMTERRLIRVLVVYNKMMFFLDRCQQMGSTHDLFMEFEKFVNERLKTGTLKTNINSVRLDILTFSKLIKTNQYIYICPVIRVLGVF